MNKKLISTFFEPRKKTETNYSSRPTLFPGKRNEEDVERISLLIRQLRKKEIRENTSVGMKNTVEMPI